MLKEERPKLKYPNYWDKDPNNWGGVNEWDIYWIENQPRSALITKQNSHTALAEELKRLNQIYTGIHPACEIISGLQNELKGIAKSDENKKIWDTRDRIASLKVESELIDLESHINEKKGRQAGLRIARRGFQVYADAEFDSVEREQKRIRANENDEVIVENASPVTTHPYFHVHIPPPRVVTLSSPNNITPTCVHTS
ncbi:hypothetical protein C1645_766370 [Glomus cerebriforme]|uniref:Uncharacterized protein n=1 Tax=Glomus cerebriforme TaxID=658196 RepID=A0A397T186_9GLOM|nr:hypothetical protein C1645_766370 [Glomus cerebriforme]